MKEDKFKTINVEESVGRVLMHDVTCILPGEFKGPAFKKGHIIKKEDMNKLRDMGKERIYAFELADDEYHEDQAAELFKKFAGKNISTSGPSEGKVQFSSEVNGMVRIDKKKVDSINSIDDIVMATVHSNINVKKDEKIAGARIIPLTVKKSNVEKALEFASEILLEVVPFKAKKGGLIVTGNEVAGGRIKDGFRPVIEKKMTEYNSEINKFKIVGDDPKILKNEIMDMINNNCEFLILTGGMSVDPDDITKKAIRDAGVDVVSYGVPVLPGNMFMVGYLKGVPVFGVPACALYFNITVLDLFLPYVFSDTRITKENIISLGYGGYCRHCEICNFPRCGFGKC
jgi:molybdenum cofactor synthesis domain-containing protein